MQPHPWDEPGVGLAGRFLGRAGFWSLGAGVGVASAIAVTDREIRPFAMILGWLATGLVGELVQAIRVLRERAEPVHLDPTPADGRVGVAKVEGAKRHLNSGDLRFGRFLAWAEPEGVHRGAAAGSRGFPPLRGRVVVASFFLGRDGRRWDDDEIARAHKSLIRAGEWIEAQAIRWGAAVNVELADTYVAADDPAVREEVEIAFVKEGDETVPDEVDAAVKGLAATGRAAATLGFRDAVDLAGALARRVEADALVWLVHSASAGRSRAVPGADTGLAGVHLAICYADEGDFPGPMDGPVFSDPITFVHELLHLFGAEDKYGIALHKFPPGAVTERDVMRLDTESLSRLRIDRQTAREIGWAGPHTPDPADPTRRGR